MASVVDECWRLAGDCGRWATESHDNAARVAFRQMAKVWAQLAFSLNYTPPPRNEPADIESSEAFKKAASTENPILPEPETSGGDPDHHRMLRQPELVARHCTEAGLVEKAAGYWGNAGQRSLDRSAIVEAATQLTRALDQIANLPATPVLRQQQIKLQVALANALMHVKGYAAPEPKAAFAQALVFIERAETLGEHPEDRCCCSQSFGVFGARITWPLTAMHYSTRQRRSRKRAKSATLGV
jgi:hypothetical protein